MFSRRNKDNFLNSHSKQVATYTEMPLVPMDDTSTTKGSPQLELKKSTSNSNSNSDDQNAATIPLTDAVNALNTADDDDTSSTITVRDSSPPPHSRTKTTSSISIAELNAFFNKANTLRSRSSNRAAEDDDVWNSDPPPHPDPRSYLPSSSFAAEHHLAGLIIGDDDNEGALGGCGASQIQPDLQPQLPCVYHLVLSNGEQIQSIPKENGFHPLQDTSTRRDGSDYLTSGSAFPSPLNTSSSVTIKHRLDTGELLGGDNIRSTSAQCDVAAAPCSEGSELTPSWEEATSRQSRFDPKARPFRGAVAARVGGEKYLGDSIWAGK